ncbi:WD40 repeat domain-containing protein [Engelhardtia mirabilis]|uniref:WD domain, G-beta repeat n=1 Tax=Engelhardtia mirabilis TaxID=2528011 RepID=A0A518BR27_9BACT|nr:WD domain, G-beta repeat [Planctomycetes bacterium Pla133]QDV03732.1 WD domain, G-beta repeat [Planctomycetes bacterium Pla86]
MQSTLRTLVLSALGLASALAASAQEPATTAPQVAEAHGLFSAWLRHDSPVVDVVWGVGADLVTLDAGGVVTQWDADSRSAVTRAELTAVTGIAFHPGGERPAGLALAHGSEPRVLEWRPALAAPALWTVEGLGGPLAVDAAGARIAAVGQHAVELVDVADGSHREVAQLGGFEVRDLAFGGGELAVLGFNRAKQLGRKGTEEQPWSTLWRVDVATGEELATVDLDGQCSEVLRLGDQWLCLDPERRAWIAGAGRGLELPLPAGAQAAPRVDSAVLPDRQLLQVDQRGQLIARVGLDGEPRPARSVGVGAMRLRPNRDGTTVALAQGCTVRLLAAAEGFAADGGAAGFAAQVSSLRFDDGGGRLLAASYDHSVDVYDVASGARLAHHGAVGIVHAAAWLGAGAEGGEETQQRFAWVARGGGLEQRTVDAAANNAATNRGLGLPWTDLAGGDGELFAVASGGAVLQCVGAGLETGWTGQGPRGAIQRIGAVPGRVVVASSGLVVLDRASGESLGALGDMGAPVQSLAAASAAPRAAVGLASGAVAVVDTDSIEVVATVAQHRGRVQAVALTADGRRLASVGTNDEALTLTGLDGAGAASWSIEIPWNGPGCTALGFSPDGRLLAAGGRDGRVVFFTLGG